MANVEQVLRDTGVIPVIKLEDEQKAVSLGRALLEGGIPAAEVTFRTPAAAKSIENIAKALPEMFVCAGTVLSVRSMGGDVLYEIEFDKVGTKKLMASFARLKKD